MISLRFLRVVAFVAACAVLPLSLSAHAQDEERHGRKYKAPPETCHITVQVLKGFNGKPISNALIVIHPMKDGKSEGGLQFKSDPNGKASLDIIAVGTTVQLQVIAHGFATYGESFLLDTSSRDFVIKMEAPKAQVSTYQDNSGKSSERAPGVQEPNKTAAGTSASPAK